MIAASDIEEMLDWQPEEQKGEHRFRQAVATPEFHRFYRSHTAAFKASGVHLSKSGTGDVFVFAWFTAGPNAAEQPVVVAPPKVPAGKQCGCPGECEAKPGLIASLGLDRDVVGQLRCYQIPGVRSIVDSIIRFRVAVNTSRLGSGKTYVACASARSLRRRLLVVAPKATVPTWRRVAQFMGCEVLGVLNYEKLRTGKTEWGTWVKVKRHEEWRWTLPEDALVAADEAHYCSGLKSQNAEILIAAADQGIALLPMSGTLASEPLKLRALGYALHLHKLYNFDDWLESCGYHEGNYGWVWKCGMSNGELFTKQGKEWVPIAKGHAELNRRRDEVMLRIRNQLMDSGKMVSLRTEDIPGFPECDHVTELVDFNDNGAIERAYAEMQTELEQVDRLERQAIKQDSRLAIQLRAQQKVELIKSPGLADMAADAVEDGLSVVLFVLFRASAEVLMKRLKTTCVVWGDQSEREREANISAFQSDTERVIIVTEQSGGAGLNLQDVTGRFPRLALVAPTFNATIYRQAGGRVHRDGSKSKCTVKAVFAAGTIEEKAKTSTDAKLHRIDLLNDGDLSIGFDFRPPPE